ncbi:MAG: hypothetical protein KDA92_22350, partial [Planctomycetales bacterium]|nr:hypothetical protein [Planctomycetales bacterium]
GGRFAIKIPTEFKVTEESTTDKDGRKWLTVQSPDVTFRLYSVDELKSAASLYEEALAADKANGFPRNSLGNFKLERAGRVYYRFDEINDGKFSSTYAADASKGVFGVLVEFKGVLAYCNNIPLLDAIVGSLVLQDAD